MDDISDAELRNRLKAYGLDSMPVTPTTRKTLIGKLQKFERASDLVQLSSCEEDNTDTVNNTQSSRRRTELKSPTSKKNNSDVNSSNSKAQNVTSRFTYVSPIASTNNNKYAKLYNANLKADENDSRYYGSGIENDRAGGSDVADRYFRHSTPNRSSDATHLNQSEPATSHSRVSRTSWILIGVIVFGIAIAYYNAKYSYQTTETIDLLSLQCGNNQRPNVDCLPSFGITVTSKVLEDVYQTLQKRAVEAECEGDSKKAVISRDALLQIIMRRHKFYQTEADAALAGIIMVVEMYPSLYVTYKNGDFMYTNPTLPLTCLVPKIVFNLFDYVFKILAGVLLVGVVLIAIMWFIRLRRNKQRELDDLVIRICEVLRTHAKLNPETPYLPIVYVKNELLSPQDRKKKNKLWEAAVDLIKETESRIRGEIQSIKGEDYATWRWLPKEAQNGNSVVNDRKRGTWQGEAFGTTKGTINSPVVSPTQCLKIRHMFDQSRDGTVDLLTLLQSAILERCEGSQILHIAVDASSEGCVYVKCASPEDAGNAYRKLHGAWFDGEIISVKYIRLERYHEHFPESVSLTTPLSSATNN